MEVYRMNLMTSFLYLMVISKDYISLLGRMSTINDQFPTLFRPKRYRQYKD